MQYKSTTNTQTAHYLIAGILENTPGIEFFGLKATRKVYWLQDGKSHPFCELKGKDAIALTRAYENDSAAKNILSKTLENEKKISYARQLELFTYYCYGSIDSTPDLVDGVLSTSENFREKTNCLSLNFLHKKLRLKGHTLKKREVCMIDLFSKDYKDTVVAEELNISMSTFNQHKRQFFQKVGVMTKPALMIAATKANLVL